MDFKIILIAMTVSFVIMPIHAKNKLQKKAEFELGRVLFFDKVLSGNKNVSCASCHNPMTFSSDNLSLGIGEGGKGLGVSRIENDKIHHRVPRNSPALFNAGHRSFKNYFHDGRIEKNKKYPSGVKSPAGFKLPEGLDSILAAQALFPVTSDVEMAGQANENEIGAYAAKGDVEGIWRTIEARLVNIPEYVEMFKSAYSDVNSKNDIKIKHMANAIAHFEKVGFKADDSPFDRYLAGDKTSLSAKQIRGMKIFYNKGKCASCHSGEMMMDNSFHSIALPPIGPGKGDGVDGKDDFGREKVTKDSKDRYKFRTPTLRNVAVTGPWGHNGAYNKLRDIVTHHLNPRKSLKKYDLSKALLPVLDSTVDDDLLTNFSVLEDIAVSSNLKKVKLTKLEINDLIAFLHSLTDQRCLEMRNLIPLRVPSGLPVGD